MMHSRSVPAPACATPFYPEDFNNPLEVVRERSTLPSHQDLSHDLKPTERTYQSFTARIPARNKHANSEARLSKVEEEVARSAVAQIFFKGRSLVEHHLRSFNEFVEFGLPAMFDEAACLNFHPDCGTLPNRIGVQRKARILYGEVSVGKPYTTITRNGKKEMVDLLPHEARLRNMSYSAHLYVTMTLEVRSLPFMHK